MQKYLKKLSLCIVLISFIIQSTHTELSDLIQEITLKNVCALVTTGSVWAFSFFAYCQYPKEVVIDLKFPEKNTKARCNKYMRYMYKGDVEFWQKKGCAIARNGPALYISYEDGQKITSFNYFAQPIAMAITSPMIYQIPFSFSMLLQALKDPKGTLQSQSILLFPGQGFARPIKFIFNKNQLVSWLNEQIPLFKNDPKIDDRDKRFDSLEGIAKPIYNEYQRMTDSYEQGTNCYIFKDDDLTWLRQESLKIDKIA